jgi:hypothetical protein
MAIDMLTVENRDRPQDKSLARLLENLVKQQKDLNEAEATNKADLENEELERNF